MMPRFGATLKKVIALTMMSSLSLFGSVSQFRSPVSLEYNYGRFGYRLPPINDDAWNLRLFGGGYARSADKVFAKKDCVCPETCVPKTNRSDVTTTTRNLAHLFFGKESFRPEEIFTNASLCNRTTCCNPWLVFSTLNPCIKFSEKGVVFGFDLRNRLNENGCYAGIRAQLPVKVVEVNHFRGCDLEVKNPNAVCTTNTVGLNGQTLSSLTARLDFLRQLKRADGSPFLQLANGSALVAGQQAAVGVAVGTPVATVLQRDSGTCSGQNNVVPTVTETAGLDRLNSDGSGLINDQVGKFVNLENYSLLAENCDALSELYLLPVLEGNNPSFTQESQYIQDELNNILLQLSINDQDNALAFFRQKGINFCKDERVVGTGNLTFDLYLGHETDCAYHDVMIGFRLPTDKTNRDPDRLYLLSTGNNGHGEFKVGIEGGWYAHSYWVFNWNVSFNHVFNTCERRAAAYECATVKNIGPSVPAEIGWSYWIAQFNWNLFHPDCPSTGMTLGGELFAKKDDNVSFLRATAVDLCGDTADLNPCLLEDNTNSLSLKVRGEVFHRHNCFELFGGASHAFAGRFAAKESEWHLGVNIYF